MNYKEFQKYYIHTKHVQSILTLLQSTDELDFLKSAIEAIDLRIDELDDMHKAQIINNIVLEKRIEHLNQIKNLMKRRLNLEIFS